MEDPREAVSKQLYDYGANVTRTQKSAILPMTGIWISVESWDQSLQALEWKGVFAEVQVMANRLDAVLVEPDITHDGRLTSCGHDESKLSLSDIYNRTQVMKNYPWLATCTEFDSFQNQLTAPKIYDLCLDPVQGAIGCETIRGDHYSPNYFQRKSMEPLEQALRDFREDPHLILLLRLHNVGVSAFDKLTVPVVKATNDRLLKEKRIQVLDRREVEHHLANNFHFQNKYYDTFQSRLKAVGHVNSHASYSVIHWNPPDQLSRSVIMDCAEKVTYARQAIDPKFKSKVFVMTGSSAAQSNGEASNVSDKALKVLSSKGIERLDPSTEDEPEIVSSVMSMIFIEHAANFVTCSDRCSAKRGYDRCQVCVGGGDAMASSEIFLDARDKGDSETLPCWPTSTKEVAAINRLWTKG